jgi:hypothetical protein
MTKERERESTLTTCAGFGFARGASSFFFFSFPHTPTTPDRGLRLDRAQSTTLLLSLSLSVLSGSVFPVTHLTLYHLRPVTLFHHLIRLLPTSVSHDSSVSNPAPVSACTRSPTHHRDPPITHPVHSTGPPCRHQTKPPVLLHLLPISPRVRHILAVRPKKKEMRATTKAKRPARKLKAMITRSHKNPHPSPM